jgi:hypothetical protein
MDPVSDHEAVDYIATSITDWQRAAQELPLPDLRATVATCQDNLAHSLNAFNGIFADHDECQECAAALAASVGTVARQATAAAIFALGLSQRVRLAAQQN